MYLNHVFLNFYLNKYLLYLDLFELFKRIMQHITKQAVVVAVNTKTRFIAVSRGKHLYRIRLKNDFLTIILLPDAPCCVLFFVGLVSFTSVSYGRLRFTFDFVISFKNKKKFKKTNTQTCSVSLTTYTLTSSFLLFKLYCL